MQKPLAENPEIGYEVSPLDSLAYAIFPAGKERRLMAKLSAMTAHFDASGHPSDQPFVVVSGYVANYYQWYRFNILWDAAHAKFGVAIPFHMSDFMARAGQYKKWAKDDPQAEAFLMELTTIQQLYMLLGVSCVVDMGTYNDINDVMMMDTMLPAYALGARSCVAILQKWQKEFSLEFPIECIFEDGDFGRGKFIELMRVERMPAPIFKDKQDFPGLQAADHIAWEQANFLKRERVGTHLPRRESFGRLLSIPHIHLQTTLESLLNVAEQKGIPIKRSKIIRP